MPRQLLQDVFRQTLHLSCSRHRVFHDVDQQHLWPDVSPAGRPQLPAQIDMRGVSCVPWVVRVGGVHWSRVQEV
jgi:hypothetical protein